MDLLVIIQARMSSKRAPGKVMRKVSGKPVLGYVIDSLENCRSDFQSVVATSTETSDDAVADYCESRGQNCIRGPIDNVAERFGQVLDTYPAAAFVRLCGDSPLLDYRLVDRAITLFCGDMPDMVTNVFPRSFPKGESVEVVATSTFLKALPRMTEPDDQEHVTRYFYRHAHRYHIMNFAAPRDLSSLQLAVDSEEDFADFVSTVMRMNRPHWTYTYEDAMALATGVLA